MRPVSEYFVTIWESGERKTTADDLAMRPVAEAESNLNRIYEIEQSDYADKTAAWEKQRAQVLSDKSNRPSIFTKSEALGELGRKPDAPLLPLLTVPEPTYEGLVHFFRDGRASGGLSSSEGGQFLCGHAMNDDNRIKTSAGLSDLWDGKPIKRSRASDGNYMLRGRRFSMHILVQPIVALAANRTAWPPVRTARPPTHARRGRLAPLAHP